MPNPMIAPDALRLEDEASIRRLLQDWGTWRDAGDWDRLRAAYTPDATMLTTWCDCPASEFIDASIRMKAGTPEGYGGHHLIGASTIELHGERALAETRITLLLRSRIEHVDVDVSCWGRFLDRLRKVDGQWRIQRRIPVYDKDAIAPVLPGRAIPLDETRLAALPAGYRYLAYVQSLGGMQRPSTLPDTSASTQKRLHAEARAWAKGD